MLDIYSGSAKANDILKDCKSIISYMLTYECSIRQCSEDLGIPKTNVHTYIHKYIRLDFPNDYDSIKNILKYNKENRGMPRKYWRRK